MNRLPFKAHAMVPVIRSLFHFMHHPSEVTILLLPLFTLFLSIFLPSLSLSFSSFEEKIFPLQEKNFISNLSEKEEKEGRILERGLVLSQRVTVDGKGWREREDKKGKEMKGNKREWNQNTDTDSLFSLFSPFACCFLVPSSHLLSYSFLLSFESCFSCTHFP